MNSDESFGEEAEIDLSFFDLENAVGWGANLELDRFINKDKQNELKIIRLAQEKISLNKIIFNYGIKFEKKQSFTGWDYIGRCPFPAHKDRHPSFGFNSIENRYNCWICGGGKSVDFLHFLTGKSYLECAKQLLKQFNIDETDLILEVEDQNKLIDEVLFKFSNKIREFRKISDKNKLIANKIMWVLDCYIEKCGFGSLEIETLKNIINKLSDYVENK